MATSFISCIDRPCRQERKVGAAVRSGEWMSAFLAVRMLEQWSDGQCSAGQFPWILIFISWRNMNKIIIREDKGQVYKPTISVSFLPSLADSHHLSSWLFFFSDFRRLEEEEKSSESSWVRWNRKEKNRNAVGRRERKKTRAGSETKRNNAATTTTTGKEEEAKEVEGESNNRPTTAKLNSP